MSRLGRRIRRDRHKTDGEEDHQQDGHLHPPVPRVVSSLLCRIIRVSVEEADDRGHHGERPDAKDGIRVHLVLLLDHPAQAVPQGLGRTLGGTTLDQVRSRATCSVHQVHCSFLFIGRVRLYTSLQVVQKKCEQF